jgi:hypothetical protein
MKTFYTIYKITCLNSDEYYIGAHKTKNLEDNYFGSGKRIKAIKKKYGVNNLKREFLFFANSQDDMYSVEKQIIAECLWKDDKCLNLVEGGIGSWDYVNQKIKSGEIVLPPVDNNGEKNPMFGKHHKKETLDLISATLTEKYSSDYYKCLFSSINTGREVKLETKIKISLNSKNTQHTEKHNLRVSNSLCELYKDESKRPMLGKITVYNPLYQCKTVIPKEDLEYYLNKNWQIGSRNQSKIKIEGSLPYNLKSVMLFNTELNKERRIRDYSKYSALINSGWELKLD